MNAITKQQVAIVSNKTALSKYNEAILSEYKKQTAYYYEKLIKKYEKRSKRKKFDMNAKQAVNIVATAAGGGATVGATLTPVAGPIPAIVFSMASATFTGAVILAAFVYDKAIRSKKIKYAQVRFNSNTYTVELKEFMKNVLQIMLTKLTDSLQKIGSNKKMIKYVSKLLAKVLIEDFILCAEKFQQGESADKVADLVLGRMISKLNTKDKKITMPKGNKIYFSEIIYPSTIEAQTCNEKTSFRPKIIPFKKLLETSKTNIGKTLVNETIKLLEKQVKQPMEKKMIRNKSDSYNNKMHPKITNLMTNNSVFKTPAPTQTVINEDALSDDNLLETNNVVNRN
ncbi:MAG: hypothetical protein Tsb005_10350 [Gammaproteobacteria bacterium]